MPDTSNASPRDPMFGNHASDLLNAALDETLPISDPSHWQPPPPEELQAMLPGYEVQAFLARGGMGAVYRGVQISLGRIVAIKILPPYLSQSDPQYSERFKQEARAMAQLNHPAIVSVYDFGQMADGTLYFIMEYIDGTDVSQMVQKSGRLHSDHAMAITAHVCDALQYAHEHGVVHRDIKPANIMVGYDGRVKVADFGLAKSLTKKQQLSLTQTGFVMGTPHFLAPEAMMMGVSVDHRADIYAVGVMLYQMLTGRLPQGIFEMPSLQVPGLDPRYDQIIVSAMREDREQRFPSVLHMRRALDAILTQPVARSEVAKQTVPPATVAPTSRQTPQQEQPAAAPKPQDGQHYYRPPQAAAPQPLIKEKTGAGTWLLTAAVVVSLGGILWMKLTASSDPLLTATKENPFINSVGMKFVPVPGTSVLMCQHETRRQDYEAYAKAVPAVNGAWKNQSSEGVPCGFQDDHPVVGVTASDGMAFCEWLSHKEGRKYRLPTDAEWSWAAGIGRLETNEPIQTPKALAGKVLLYPWGSQELTDLSDASGNFADKNWAAKFGSTYGPFRELDDGFITSAPVMSFKPNGIGVYDLSGNAWEWVSDWWDEANNKRVLRGCAWGTWDSTRLLLSCRLADNENGRGSSNSFRCVIEAPAKFPDVEFSNSPSLPSATGVSTTPPLTSISPVSDPDLEKELTSYSWKIIEKNWVAYSYAWKEADNDWIAYFQRDNEVIVREGARYTPWYWWVVGPRKIHVQFSGQGPAFKSNIGEDWELDAAMTRFTRISDGKLVGQRDRSPPATATGEEIGFVTLLGDNGSDGWKYSGHPNGRVNQANGIYSFKARSGEDEAGMFWHSKRSFTDFVLRLEFRMNEFKKNSGIYLRLPSISEGVQPLNYSQGCEVEIAGHKTGIITYTPQGNVGPPPLIVGDWNTYEITAHGTEIEARLNGILTTKHTSTRGTSGYIGIQDFNDNMAIEFRNVRIKELSSSARTTTAQTDPDLRTFTDTQGRTIRAALSKISGEDIVLRKDDGTDYIVKAATLSAADIDYLKTKGLVMPQAPAASSPPAMAAVTSPKAQPPPIPVKPAPKSTALALDSVNMKLKEPWMPHNIHTRKEWLAALDFYSKEVIKQGVRTPTTIWGSFNWLMPLKQATSLLPRDSYKLKTVTASKLAYPEGISVEFWHVGGKGYEDNLEFFDEIAFVLDEASRLVSLQLGENSYKTLNWRWQDKGGPDGDRNPYYDFLNDSANGKNGRKIFYQFRPGPAGVTNVKLVLDGSTSSHWYLTEPLAQKFIEIYAEVNKQGL